MGRQAGAGSSEGACGELRQSVRVGKLNLVDLAGSERVHITGAKGTSHFSSPPPVTPPLLIEHLFVRMLQCALVGGSSDVTNCEWVW